MDRENLIRNNSIEQEASLTRTEENKITANVASLSSDNIKNNESIIGKRSIPSCNTNLELATPIFGIESNEISQNTFEDDFNCGEQGCDSSLDFDYTYPLLSSEFIDVVNPMILSSLMFKFSESDVKWYGMVSDIKIKCKVNGKEFTFMCPGPRYQTVKIDDIVDKLWDVIKPYRRMPFVPGSKESLKKKLMGKLKMEKGHAKPSSSSTSTPTAGVDVLGTIKEMGGTFKSRWVNAIKKEMGDNNKTLKKAEAELKKEEKAVKELDSKNKNSLSTNKQKQDYEKCKSDLKSKDKLEAQIEQENDPKKKKELEKKLDELNKKIDGYDKKASELAKDYHEKQKNLVNSRKCVAKMRECNSKYRGVIKFLNS